MATNTAIKKGEERSAKRQEPGALVEFGGGAMNKWQRVHSLSERCPGRDAQGGYAHVE